MRLSAATDMAKLCAIDVGSNGIRLSVANLTPKGLETIDYQRIPVRLGSDVFRHGKISPTSLNATMAAFRGFAKSIAMHEPAAVRAIATSALREAKNRESVIRQIAAKTGIQIETISGEEEARLAFLAIADKVNLDKATALLIDIGGGSIEISLTHKGAIQAAESFKLGTVRLLEIFSGGQGDAQQFYNLLDEYAETMIAGIRTVIGKRPIDFAVGTGGNIEALGQLGRARFRGTSANKLTTTRLAGIVKLLESLTYKQRIAKLGLRPDRADVIVPAAVILLRILKRFHIPQLLIPGIGVKDGVMLDLAHAYTGTSGDIGQEHVLPSTKQIALRYGTDLEHAERVAGFALELFKALQRLHGYGQRERLLLHCAALLHDVGKAINVNDHHKHSQYIVRYSPIVGLSADERNLVSLIARYHRKSLPKPGHLEFMALDAADRKRVKYLGGMLRLTNAMDIEHGGQVKEVAYRLRNGALHVTVAGKTDLALELWAMRQRANLLSEASGLNISISRRSKR